MTPTHTELAEKLPVTREGYEFLKVLATFMDMMEPLSKMPLPSNHPFVKTFEFFESYLPKVKALEAASSESTLKELRAEIFRTATTGFNASRFKKYVIEQIDALENSTTAQGGKKE